MPGWLDEHASPPPRQGAGLYPSSSSSHRASHDSTSPGSAYVEGSFAAARPGSPNALLRRAFERAFNRPAPAGVRIHDGWDELTRRHQSRSPPRHHPHPLPLTHPHPPQREFLFVGSSSLGAVAVHSAGVILSSDTSASTTIPAETIVELAVEDGVVTVVTSTGRIQLEFSGGNAKGFVEAVRGATEAAVGVPCTVRSEWRGGGGGGGGVQNGGGVTAVCDLLLEGMGAGMPERIGELLEELHSRLNGQQQSGFVDNITHFIERHKNLENPTKSGTNGVQNRTEVPKVEQKWAIPPSSPPPASLSGSTPSLDGNKSVVAVPVKPVGLNSGGGGGGGGVGGGSSELLAAPAAAMVLGGGGGGGGGGGKAGGTVAVPPRAIFLPKPKGDAVRIDFLTPPHHCAATIEALEKGLQYSLDNVDPKGPLNCIIYDGLARLWFPELGVSLSLPKDKSQWMILGTLRELCIASGTEHNIPPSLETTAVTVTLLRSSQEESYGVSLEENSLVLSDKCPEMSPAGRVGMNRLVGWVVTHSNKQPVTTNADIGVSMKLSALSLSLRLSRPRCIVCTRQDRQGEFRKSGFKCKECFGKKHGAASPESSTK